MFDETPEEYKFSKNKEIAQLSHAKAVCNTHVYSVPEGTVVNEELYNLSQYRARGYNVGSLMSKAGEPDKYYKQPGHPLSEVTDKGGRFKVCRCVLQAVDAALIIALSSVRRGRRDTPSSTPTTPSTWATWRRRTGRTRPESSER